MTDQIYPLGISSMEIQILAAISDGRGIMKPKVKFSRNYSVTRVKLWAKGFENVKVMCP